VRFIKCFPADFTSAEKIALFHAYYYLILPSYGKMKSGDTLRLLRKSTKTSAVSKMPTRVKAAVAHEKAKTK